MAAAAGASPNTCASTSGGSQIDTQYGLVSRARRAYGAGVIMTWRADHGSDGDLSGRASRLPQDYMSGRTLRPAGLLSAAATCSRWTSRRRDRRRSSMSETNDGMSSGAAGSASARVDPDYFFGRASIQLMRSDTLGRSGHWNSRCGSLLALIAIAGSATAAYAQEFRLEEVPSADGSADRQDQAEDVIAFSDHRSDPLVDPSTGGLMKFADWARARADAEAVAGALSGLRRADRQEDVRTAVAGSARCGCTCMSPRRVSSCHSRRLPSIWRVTRRLPFLEKIDPAIKSRTLLRPT